MIFFFVLVTKEAQVEAAERNQDLPENSPFGEKKAIIRESILPR